MPQPSHRNAFRELAIADVGTCLILVPTDLAPAPPSLLGLSPAHRCYSDRGWVFIPGAPLATLLGLYLQPPEGSLSTPPRLTPGSPIGFEIRSSQPLPPALTRQATLLYQFSPEEPWHYGCYRGLSPLFVQLYPFRSAGHFSSQIRHFLKTEGEFFRQQQRLRRRPDRDPWSLDGA